MLILNAFSLFLRTPSEGVGPAAAHRRPWSPHPGPEPIRHSQRRHHHVIAFAKIALGLNPSTCGVEQAQLHSDQLASFAVADDLDRETAAGLSDDGSDRDAQGVLHAV